MLITLQAARLLLVRGGPTEQQVETYHDRIRETVVAHLTPDALRERHRRLAVALRSSAHAEDPEVLAEHFHRSGDLEQAGEYYLQAAEQAVKSLAFDRAVTLYRLALEVGRFEGEARRGLQKSLGRSLANAGRGAEAGQAYLDAAIGAPAAQTLELQRLAGEQFMRAGHIDKGLEVLRGMLRSIGISLPETRRQLLWSLLWSKIKVWWRGAKFRERDANQIPADELARIDLCHSIGWILSQSDNALGSALWGYFFPLALDAGEPKRVAIALGGLACVDAIAGGPNQQRGEVLLRQALELAERTGDPYTRSMVEFQGSGCALLLGQWRKAGEFVARAENLLRKECTGVAWEIGIACHQRFSVMTVLGEWKQIAEKLPPLLKEARERGDLFTTTRMLIHSGKLEMAADEPERARQTYVEALRPWMRRGFTLQHHEASHGDVDACLYMGKADEAWTAVNQHCAALNESLLVRLQLVRVIWTQLRGRCALAAAFALNSGKKQTELIRSAERDARQLERERMPYANPFAQLIRAAIAFHRGKLAEAVSLLELAAARFEAVDVLLSAAVARWQLGKLLGGERGRTLVQKATAFMTDQGIRNPPRIVYMYAPGFSTD